MLMSQLGDLPSPVTCELVCCTSRRAQERKGWGELHREGMLKLEQRNYGKTNGDRIQSPRRGMSVAAEAGQPFQDSNKGREQPHRLECSCQHSLP